MALVPLKFSETATADPMASTDRFLILQNGAVKRLAPADAGAALPRGSTWFTGDDYPANSMPGNPGGIIGDMYLKNIDPNGGSCWRWTGAEWVYTGADITGPPGSPASPGVLLFLEAAGHFYTQAINSSALSTIAGAANRIDLAPFVPTKSFTCDQIAINVTTAVASALAKAIVYSSDANGRPDARILETGDMDCSGTGAKAVSVNQAFVAGTIYWVGVRHSSTATLRGIPVASLPSLGVAAATSSAVNTMVRRTLTYATGAPSSWVFSAAELASAIAPVVFMRST